MKNLIISIAMLLSVNLFAQTNVDSLKTIDLKEVVVSSIRATDKTPMTFNEVSKKEIEENNLGKDLPYLLELTPSAVTTSDGGSGIGYTGIRIRGSDATRVNVTINGIPYNDPESMGVFWVNLPDFSSSISSIQVQRGVGTSSNGAGAFGASINIATDGLNINPYGKIDATYGSFNSHKLTFSGGSGLLNDKYTVDARVSQIKSDGYIDRSSVDLKSYFVSTGYHGKKTSLKFNTFGGHERTYQAWYGTPESRVNDDQDEMQRYIDENYLSTTEADNLLNSGRTYNYYTYDNEVDDYKQTHYQLLSSTDLSSIISLDLGLFFIHGEGYFEQFKGDDDFSDYGLSDLITPSDTTSSGDIALRRWLDNDFYGGTYALNISPSNDLSIIFGGAANKYDGDHFGRLLSAGEHSASALAGNYYFSNSIKKDFSNYLKVNWAPVNNLSLFGDVQHRLVEYTMLGNDNDFVNIDQHHDYSFWNPKFGLNYQFNDQLNSYISYAHANKEPIRNDFVDNGDSTPAHEQLNNLELGLSFKSNAFIFDFNFYNMAYKDQLVLTGGLNDVGSSLRTNVAESFRRGLEIQMGAQLSPSLTFNLNATMSENKIEDYTEIIDNSGDNWEYYPAERDPIHHSNVDIAFSPNLIAGGTLTYQKSEFKASLIQKYVGEQFLDNTSNNKRKLDSYYLTDLVINYSPLDDLNLKIGVYNLFDLKYSSNGYTWGYRGGGDEFRENFQFPQAGINFMLGLSYTLD